MTTPSRLLSAAAFWGLLGRPDLWPWAMIVGARLVEPGWWRRWPPLPRLPRAYQDLRHEVMFGSDPRARLGRDELVAYLEWCARMARRAR